MQRSDARRNRSALVRAAQEVLTDRGAQVPLEEIARAAGVSRGTLYRHFPDRLALASAIYELRLEEFERYAEEHAAEPTVMLDLLAEITSRQPSARGLVALLQSAPAGHERMDALTGRTRELFAGPLRTSQAAGRVTPGYTVEDLLLVLAMVEGVVEATPVDAAGEAVATCMRIVLRGIVPRAGS